MSDLVQPTRAQPAAAPASHLLSQVQAYLAAQATTPAERAALESAWRAFHQIYTERIRKYAFRCGAREEDIGDCVQDVWTELLLRLPTFRHDPTRGQFDSWLFHIVRGKTANHRREKQRRPLQEHASALYTAIDRQPTPARKLEDAEIFVLASAQLQQRLSRCNYDILYLRLIENRPVPEVAQLTGLTEEQVCYRYHRARKEAEHLGAAWPTMSANASHENSAHDENKNFQKSAQEVNGHSVSRTIHPTTGAPHGGPGVDYVFHRVELGRRELTPEWKVEWNCDNGVPRPTLHIRKMSIVAYAEICGHEEFIKDNWPRIVHAAIAAGVAAGIATIITAPTGAMPVFQREFFEEFQQACTQDGRLQIALATRQEANGP